MEKHLTLHGLNEICMHKLYVSPKNFGHVKFCLNIFAQPTGCRLCQIGLWNASSFELIVEHF